MIHNLSNLKMISAGAAIYLSDYDEVEPCVQSMKGYRDALNPYIKNNQLWVPNEGQVSPTLYNFSLSGVRVTDEMVDRFVIRLWYGVKWKDREGFHYATVDTSARFVPTDKWEPIRATMDLQWPRVATRFHDP
ncbi:hypothetical protein QPK87_05230 [Kamptonema cortianum]|nr:hypothetical protein [Kamptonema cortianum]